MFSTEKLKSFLFFDIETCGQHPNYSSLIAQRPEADDIFTKKCQRLNNGKSWTGNPEQDYSNNVALFPEFGRIACLSYGVWKPEGYTIASICEEDEVVMLKKIANLFNRASGNGMIPTGWNIKNFDVSWIVRRLHMNNIRVPECLSSYDKKPWEVNIFDLKDFWKSGSSLDTTFEEACYGMGIPTPKDDIDGSQVHKTFWNGEHERVKTYCEKDVKGMILLCEKIFQTYNAPIHNLQ